jgi:hypothetical protein
MWISRPGDRFTHPSSPEALICDRITQTPDGQKWLWAGGISYPLAETDPIGIWQALQAAFVMDLAEAKSWNRVEKILDGLDPGQRKQIWEACPLTLRQSLWAMRRKEAPQAEQKIEAAN